MRYREFCLVCRLRITDVGWDPVCCEVCWDSLDAEERRWAEANMQWVFAIDGETGLATPLADLNMT